MAGVTTFVVMSYIIFVNPQILSFAGIEGLSEIGLPFNQVLAATCLVAGVMTIIMGLYTNKAYTIAPARRAERGRRLQSRRRRGAVLPGDGARRRGGSRCTILVLTGMRERIMDAIPLDLKKAIAIGIGLFIAFIGLVNSGLVIRGDGTIVDLAPPTTWPAFVTLFGLVFTIALRHEASRRPPDRDRATTILATVINEKRATTAPASRRARPGGRRVRDARPLAARRVQLRRVHRARVHLRDRLGVLALPRRLLRHDGHARGVGKPAGYLDENGREDIRKPLLVDSLAAVAGGAASTSSATTYIESASGVSVGGHRLGRRRRGRLFFPFMFIAPIIGMVPPQATAPALILVGFLMMSVLTEAEEDAEGVRTAASSLGSTSPMAIGLGAATDDHVHAVHLLDHGRDRDGLPRLHGGTCRHAARSTVHVGRLGAVLYFAVPFLQDTFDWI